MERGNIAIVTRFIPTINIKKGTIVKLLGDETNGYFEAKVIFPRQIEGNVFLILSNRLTSISSTYTEESIRDGAILLLETRNDEYVICGNSNYVPKAIKKPNQQYSNVSFDHYIKIFKYIPIRVNRSYGFYNDSIKKLVYQRYRTDPKSGKTSSYWEFLDANEEMVLYHFDIKPLLEQCKFKVKSYINSAKLFSYGEYKKELVGSICEVSKLELQTSVKKSTELQDTIYITGNGRTTRFLLSDIEIIYPNIGGLYPKKDRTISVGTIVKVIKDNKLSFAKKNDKLLVCDLKKIRKNSKFNSDKVYLGFQVNNKIVYSDIRKFKLTN